MDDPGGERVVVLGAGVGAEDVGVRLVLEAVFEGAGGGGGEVSEWVFVGFGGRRDLRREDAS